MGAGSCDSEATVFVAIDQNVTQVIVQAELQETVTRACDCPSIADHGFRTELSASAIVHILVNPVIEVSFEPFFLHKNALTSLRN